jgi:hypothetical protein
MERPIFIKDSLEILLGKAEVFEWTAKCQTAWEDIKN